MEDDKMQDTPNEELSAIQEDDGDEEQFAGQDLTCILAKGKELLKSGQYDASLTCLSYSIQKRIEELDGDETNPDLAPIYLDYGDALLTKEENSNDLFDFLRGPKSKTQQPGTEQSVTKQSGTTNQQASVSSSGEVQQPPSSASEIPDDEQDITDEQLAWEMLEMARLTYSKRLSDLEKTPEGVPRKEVEDASFVHIRLGDMLTLQEQFEDAAKEYSEAIALRQRFSLPYPLLESATLSLAQAQLFSNQHEKALDSFRLCFKYIQDHLAGCDGHTVPQDKRQDYVDTLEDLKVQIEETERSMSMAKTKPEDPAASSSTKFVKEEDVKTTTSTFDTPQLKGEVLDIGVVSSSDIADKTNSTGTTQKRRRIDLTAVQHKQETSDSK